jgi:uncharacterized RDD family membrane protein YckC
MIWQSGLVRISPDGPELQLGLPARRCFARGIDSFLLAVAAEFIGTSRFGIIAVVVLSAGYEVVCTRLYGGTPVKRFVQLAVVSGDTGQRVTWAQSFLRWVFPASLFLLSNRYGFAPDSTEINLVAWLPNFIATIVSVLLIYNDRLRRAISDRVAGTIVITTDQ